MPADAKQPRPIIVIKKKISGGGHHGGAWKVAYADFVTAMMSLFIVLWLLNSTPQIQKAVAGYFNDPSSSGKETGTKTLGAGESISIDKQNVAKLKDEIEKAILKQADLNKLSKQIEITVTGEGLKIELIEQSGGTFFQSGSPKLSDSGVELLNVLSTQLKALPNRLLIEGHTDAQPYSSDNAYTNWELSSDRANSARRVLQQGGIGPTQISQVRGYADQMLRVPANPLDPSNRRISLIVQWVDPAAPPVPPAAAPTAGAATDATQPPPAPAAPNPQASSQPQPAAPTPPATPTPQAPPQVQVAAAAKRAPPPVQPGSAPAKPTWTARIQSLIPTKKK
ncbi:MAG: flagellar motor protein MotB [Acidobacteriaceae bacterium]|jgi:chemotaxis protein MotB